MGFLELPKNPRSVLNTRVAESALVEARAYWLTDEQALVVATGPNTYTVFEPASNTRIAAAAYALAFGG